MTKRRFQVLMLTAAVWLMCPGKSQAASITQTLSFGTGAFQGDVAHFGIGQARYDFGLVFDLVVAPFTVAVTPQDNPNLGVLPPGYTCVPINGGANCIMFTATPSNPNAWVGNYTLTIAWIFDTNALYPNTPVNQSGLGRIRILHFDSAGVTDITSPNSYCATCGAGEDPAIGGKDDNFSNFIVTQTSSVPEPGTMALLGMGLGVLAVRLRRRRRLS